jgi:hypothetical protein
MIELDIFKFLFLKACANRVFDTKGKDFRGPSELSVDIGIDFYLKMLKNIN